MNCFSWLWSSRSKFDPLADDKYFAPLMSSALQKAITVRLEDVETKLKHVLDDYGVAVVSCVVPTDVELQELESFFKEDLAELIDARLAEDSEVYKRFQEDGPRSLPLGSAKRLSRGNGFLLSRCLPHGRFAWAVRKNANVERVYRALHAEELQQSGPGKQGLVASMDVTFFSPDAEPVGSAADFSAHCDQNRNDVRDNLATRPSFQGVVYVWPAGERSSTTVVWPRSHKTVWHRMMNDAAFKQYGEWGLHYCEIREMKDKKLAQELAQGWQRNCCRCVVPAGSMLLWNSRTLHTGWLGGARLAQPVCMEPEARRSQVARLGKLRLAALGLPSTHWASEAMQHDMAKREAGYFSGYQPGGDQHNMQAAEKKDEGNLPLRYAIRPRGMRSDADLEELSTLVKVKFDLTCIWRPSNVEEYQWLEGTVSDDVLDYL